MLRVLDTEGEEAGSNYNDGENVLGWFSWTVRDSVLEIKHQDDQGVITTARWKLTPQ